MTTDGSASGGLPLNLTLESGNHDQPRPRVLVRMGLMRPLAEGERDELIEEDAVEEKFAQWASQDPAWARDLNRLRAAYRQLKGRHADELASKSRAPFSCNSLLCHWTFKPPAALLTGDYCTGKTQTEIRSGDNFSNWSCRVASAILQDSFDGLHLVSLTERPEPKDVDSLFSFSHQLAATLLGCIRTIHLVPTQILLVMIKYSWGISMLPSSLDNWHDYDANKFTEPRPLLPPSLRLPVNTNPREATTRLQTSRFWGEGSNRPGNLDPDRAQNEIFLVWQSEATQYTGDFYEYIWEYHKSAPHNEYAKIMLQPSESEGEADKLLIAFHSCRAHMAFVDKRNNHSSANLSSSGIPATQSWSRKSEIIFTLQCIFEIMIEDTSKFVGECDQEIQNMTAASRREPTISKMRFMMHQEDCLKSARNGLKHAMSVLATLRKLRLWMGTHDARWDGGISFQDRAEKIRKDMKFLDTQLTQLESDMDESKERLRQYFQLSQDMTMFRLTILAAIFLPLSFGTSFFGMNMNSITAEGPLGFSAWMNETLGALPTDSRNATQAILSTIGTSGTLSYGWKTFGITAGCLLLSLPLSLMIGTLLRAIILWSIRSAKYWRYVTVVGAYES
ncbi:hypothetical protein BKA56DRAFT_735852 [Ilyonectria sp. MPI-CAGE-AT-0026]|nr:hypothetical protein BKA56DRAFT_735852 [Ilyonectria sp. MPI-CAGE-AT-0026]